MKDISDSPGKWISVLYRHSLRYITRELKPLKIGSGQYIFLLQLYQEDGVRQENLSEKLLIDKGTTTRALVILEKEGYITRRTDPLDKRATRVFLTQKALDIKEDIINALYEWNERLLKDLDHGDRKMLVKLLKHAAGNISSIEN